MSNRCFLTSGGRSDSTLRTLTELVHALIDFYVSIHWHVYKNLRGTLDIGVHNAEHLLHGYLPVRQQNLLTKCNSEARNVNKGEESAPRRFLMQKTSY